MKNKKKKKFKIIIFKKNWKKTINNKVKISINGIQK